MHYTRNNYKIIPATIPPILMYLLLNDYDFRSNPDHRIVNKKFGFEAQIF